MAVTQGYYGEDNYTMKENSRGSMEVFESTKHFRNPSSIWALLSGSIASLSASLTKIQVPVGIMKEQTVEYFIK